MPRYARGLRLLRIGVIMMLLQLALALVVTVKTFIASGESIAWFQYVMWAHLAAAAAMLVGTLIALPDFIAVKLSPWRIAIAALGFVVAAVALLSGYSALAHFLEISERSNASFLELEAAATRLESMTYLAIVRDVGYALGVLSIVRSVRDTAQTTESYELRDAADRLRRRLAVLLVADILYQATHRYAIGLFLALIMVAAGVALLGYWIHCHLDLAKFLRGAAILVDHPHDLPTAWVVDRSEPAPAAAPRRQSQARLSVPAVAPPPHVEAAPGKEPTLLR